MKKKACIFDLDGTLLNTIKDLGISCNAALESVGLSPLPLEKYPFLVGNGMKNLIIKASGFSSDTAEFHKVFKAFSEYYENHGTDFTFIYPGITELLGKLKESGVLLAVLSNKDDVFVKKLVSYYFGDNVFYAVCGKSDRFAVKPDPASLLDIISQMHIDKSDVLYIGDSDVDVLTAKNAGVFCVGAVWGFRGEAELKKAGSDALAFHPDDIMNFI